MQFALRVRNYFRLGIKFPLFTEPLLDRHEQIVLEHIDAAVILGPLGTLAPRLVIIGCKRQMFYGRKRVNIPPIMLCSLGLQATETTLIHRYGSHLFQ